MQKQDDLLPVIVPIQLGLLLRDNYPLLALFVSLATLDSLGLLEGRNITALAELLGLAKEHLSTQLKRLEGLQLVKKLKTGRETSIELQYPSYLADVECLRNILNVNENANNSEAAKVVDYQSKYLRKKATSKQNKTVTPSFIFNLYNQDIIKTITSNNKRRFPQSDYDLVINAYQKYAGIKLRGPELKDPRRVIRLMFLADRSPKDIIRFMKWLHQNSRDEIYKYRFGLWDIWTVRKWLPHFLGGRLVMETDEESDGFLQL